MPGTGCKTISPSYSMMIPVEWHCNSCAAFTATTHFQLIKKQLNSIVMGLLGGGGDGGESDMHIACIDNNDFVRRKE